VTERFEKKLKTPMGAGVAAMKGGGQSLQMPSKGRFSLQDQCQIILKMMGAGLFEHQKGGKKLQPYSVKGF
jgi:hypothetical protein